MIESSRVARARQVVIFLQSALFQQLGHALRLDVDGDGNVDHLDVVKALASTRCGKALRLEEVYATLRRWQQSSADRRLEKIEALLGEKSAANGGAAAGGGGVAGFASLFSPMKGKPKAVSGKAAPTDLV